MPSKSQAPSTFRPTTPSHERPGDRQGQDSAIRLLDQKTGREYATATGAAVVHASTRVRWRSPLVFEVHRMRPHEYGEHVVVGHQLMLNFGAPVRLGWREGDQRHDGTLTTGALCIQSDGDTNAPLWRDEMTFATASIPTSMVATLLQERAPKPEDTFYKKHCVPDPVAYAYARSLSAEVSIPTEPLYVEMLSLAFVLHLLGIHGRSPGRKELSPKGRLRPSQLRNVIELAHCQLASDLTIEAMATVSGYSPFQFARLFKATTGLAPHRFVLELRVERASRLLREGATSLADIALATGFYDQAHFTNVFRKALGVTPTVFAARA
jgi:AraC family transcriptional regulator